MTPSSPTPTRVVVEIDGERRVLNGARADLLRALMTLPENCGRLLTIVEMLMLGAKDIQKKEPMQISIHCGLADDDVKVQVPKTFSKKGNEK